MYFRLWRPTSTFSTRKTEQDEEDLNKPIQYSSSPAAKWKAKVSRTGDPYPRLWYEPYVIMVSMAVFMVYFTILREESDIDEELSRSLYSRIEGLEEQQLRIALEYNKEQGSGTDDIVKRLKELEKEKIEKPSG